MNEEIDLDESMDDEPDLVTEVVIAGQNGAELAIFALADAIKKAGLIDEKALISKVERIISSTSLTDLPRARYEQPLKQILWAMSDRSAEEELRIFGDLKVNRAPTPPGE